MALKYIINTFETDPSDASKTLVTFVVEDDVTKQTFVISKSVTTGSSSDAQLCTAAQSAAQSEINTWASNNANVGKVWNPDTESIE
tara:strand:+ start:957 stop:1214 length:258 start_codon:yes stop_codon:yes gene_type:complete